MDSYQEQNAMTIPGSAAQTTIQQLINPDQERSMKFMDRITQLSRENNREIRKPPRVGRKDLDLYQLYLAVQKRGGYTHVMQWKELAVDLKLPPSVTNAGYTLRTKYESFILPFEQTLLKEFPVGEIQRPQENWIQSHSECRRQQM